MGARLSSTLCECGLSPPGEARRGDGTIDPTWKFKAKRQSTKTWALDGLPPSIVSNARSIAASILADAKSGRRDRIEGTLEAELLSPEQAAVLLGATDLANGNTALMLAAKNGHADCCTILLKRGADPLARNHHNQTAADLATAAGHSEVVDVLSDKNTGNEVI